MTLPNSTTGNADRPVSEELSRTASPTSAALLERALKLTATQTVLAQRLHMTRGRLCHVFQGERLGVERCMMLADVLSEDPAVVLYAFGYGVLSEILRRFYARMESASRPQAAIEQGEDGAR